MSASFRARRFALGGVLLGWGTTLPGQGRAEFAEVHMGVPVRLVVHAASDSIARSAARAAYARIAELDAIMSDYRAESEVRRLSDRHERNQWIRVSPDLFAVLERALAVARVSEGAFDPTVGPLVALWREARRDRRLPDPAVLALTRDRVAWNAVRLDTLRRAVCLTRDSMRFDLGAIAKGYILQAALEALREHGVSSALVEAGGDIVLGEAPPGRAGWIVDIAGRDTLLSRVAIATSGPTEQFIEIGGVRYSHVIDLRTGHGAAYGSTARIVTVIADVGATADAIATALSVAGPAQDQALRAFPGVRRVITTEVLLPGSPR